MGTYIMNAIILHIVGTLTWHLSFFGQKKMDWKNQRVVSFEICRGIIEAYAIRF